MSNLLKKSIVVTTEEFILILDSLELMESKISAKINNTIQTKKRRKLKDMQSTIQELIIDLVDDDSEEILSWDASSAEFIEIINTILSSHLFQPTNDRHITISNITMHTHRATLEIRQDHHTYRSANSLRMLPSRCPYMGPKGSRSRYSHRDSQ